MTSNKRDNRKVNHEIYIKIKLFIDIIFINDFSSQAADIGRNFKQFSKSIYAVLESKSKINNNLRFKSKRDEHFVTKSHKLKSLNYT